MLVDLRLEYEVWLTRIEDTGVLLERAHFASIWPGGLQPETEPPVFNRLEDGRVVLTSATRGASVGYRLLGETVWQIYTEPVSVPAGARMAAVAQRLGYAWSKIRVLRWATER